MKQPDLSFWEVIAKYEEVNPDYPFDDYLSLKRDDISINRRIEKIKGYLEWMLYVLKNAEKRYNAKYDLDKLEEAFKIIAKRVPTQFEYKPFWSDKNGL